MTSNFNHIYWILLAMGEKVLQSLRMELGYSGVIVPAKALEDIVDTLLKSVEVLMLADLLLHGGRKDVQKHRSQMSIR